MSQIVKSLPQEPTVQDATHGLLIQAAILLHRYGTPSHRLERVMSKVAGSLGVQGVFLYTPTALIISVTDERGESTYLRRVESGAVDIDKLIRFDETLESLEAGEIDVATASRKLDEVAAAAAPFSVWLTFLACAISCAAIAVLFRGTWLEVAGSAIIGLIVALLGGLHPRLGWEHGFLEPVSGFVAAVASLAIARFVVPLDDRLVTLAALIVLLPGLKLTIALTELTVGHLLAGVSRLAGACVSLLTITVGVALGWRLAAAWRTLPIDAAPLEPHWQWLAIGVAPISFAIVFQARWRLWPVIAVVSIAGFVSSYYSGQLLGSEGGAFCGALAIGLGSNLYARLRDRPALVPLTPGIIILVPGSLGYRSLTAFLDRDPMVGIDFAFSMVLVAISLVGGILTAGVLLPPRRIL